MKTEMEAYIFEKGELVKAKDYSERVFCGYYAACGFNGDNAGDLFVCLSGPILAPAYDKRGKRINVGKELAGMSSRDGNEWYKE